MVNQIVGGVVGGVLLCLLVLAIMGGVCVCIIKVRKNKKVEQNTGPAEPVDETITDPSYAATCDTQI